MLNNNRGKIFWLLSISSFVLVASYIYFVQSSVFYVVSAHTLGVKQNELTSGAGSLESDYYKLSQTVSPEAGMQSGLIEAKEISYVDRNSGVSLNIGVTRAR